MKNSANALAPAAVCANAATGSTGGFSPGCRKFGPVVGTSAGTVGRLGVGEGLGALDGATGVDTWADDDGASPADPEQAARQSAANAAIAAFARTRHIMPQLPLNRNRAVDSDATAMIKR
jgi:hypothetical protein